MSLTAAQREAEYADELGRCERMGEYVPETELISIRGDVVAGVSVELLICRNCADELGIE